MDSHRQGQPWHLVIQNGKVHGNLGDSLPAPFANIPCSKMTFASHVSSPERITWAATTIGAWSNHNGSCLDNGDWAKAGQTSLCVSQYYGIWGFSAWKGNLESQKKE